MCSILKNRFWCHKSSDTFIGPLPVSPPGAMGSQPGPQSERVQSPVYTLRGPHPPDPHPACRAAGALGSRHPADARRPVPEQRFPSQLCPAGMVRSWAPRGRWSWKRPHMLMKGRGRVPKSSRDWSRPGGCPVSRRECVFTCRPSDEPAAGQPCLRGNVEHPGQLGTDSVCCKGHGDTPQGPHLTTRA